MDIPSNFKPNKKQKNIKKTAETDSIFSLNSLGEPVDINPEQIKEACAQAAKEAFDLGETNDKEDYQKQMEDVLTRVLNEKSQKKR